MLYPRHLPPQLFVPRRPDVRDDVQPGLCQQRHRLHSYAVHLLRTRKQALNAWADPVVAPLALLPPSLAPSSPPLAPRSHAANTPKIVTVQKSANTSVCSGTQIGSYATALGGVTCTGCQQGPASGSLLCGTSLGVPTFCCYRPFFVFGAAPNPQPTPSDVNMQAYPYITLPLTVPLTCLISTTVLAAPSVTDVKSEDWPAGWAVDGVHRAWPTRPTCA